MDQTLLTTSFKNYVLTPQWFLHICLIPHLAVPEEVYMAVRHQQQPDVFIW